MEKNLVLTFALALRDRIEKSGKYRVVMTRTDDTFIPLDERVRIARAQSARAVRLDPCRRAAAARGRCAGRDHLHAVGNGLRRRSRAAGGGGKQADAIARRRSVRGAADVADILIDLAQRETTNLFQPFRPRLDGRDEDHGPDAQAPAEVGRLPGAEGARRAVGADRTRLCLEQGRPRASGLGELADPDGRRRWRRRSTRFWPNGWSTARAGQLKGRAVGRPVRALVWPQRQPYKKATEGLAESVKFPRRTMYYRPRTASRPAGLS